MEDATQSPAAYLPDDLVVDILSRLPVKSLCRFRCVSKSWRALVSNFTTSSPCFFFRQYRDGKPCLGFVTAEGDGNLPLVDSALSFLPAASRGEVVTLLDSCNGLLLLRCSSPTANGGDGAGATAPPSPAFYVVCNPATGEWVALPQPSLEPGFDNFYTKACSAALGFDPAAFSHFHVFQLEEKEHSYDHFVKAVEIYSSETRTWVRKEMGWTRPHRCLFLTGHMTYLNGFLHLTTWNDVIAMVDARGEAWRTIDVPPTVSRGSGFVGHSQGRLVYVHVRTTQAGAGKLAIYALEDHSGSERWRRKHKVGNAFLFGPGKLPSYGLDENPVVAFHPTRRRFFFYDRSG